MLATEQSINIQEKPSRRKVFFDAVNDSVERVKYYQKPTLQNLVTILTNIREVDEDAAGGDWTSVDSLIQITGGLENNSIERKVFCRVLGRYIDANAEIAFSDEYNTTPSKMAFDRLGKIYQVGNRKQKEKIFSIFERYGEKTSKFLEKDSNQLVGYMADRLIPYRRNEQDQDFLGSWCRIALGRELRSHPEETLNACFSHCSSEKEIKQRSIALIESFRIDERTAKNIVDAWMSFNFDAYRGTYKLNPVLRYQELVLRNISVLKELTENPEVGLNGVVGLNKEFGICHFGKYNQNDLARQWINKDRIPKGRVGLSVSMQHDWNLSGYNAQTKMMYFRLLHSVKHNGFETFFTEAGNNFQLASIYRRMAKRYGSINFLIIDYHGNPNSIHFGDRQRTIIDSKTIDSESAKNIALECFSPNMPVALLSCKGGKGQKPIADAFSKLPNVGEVVAYPDSVYSALLLLFKNRGRLKFHAKYNDEMINPNGLTFENK
jgi:hypothetical protein